MPYKEIILLLGYKSAIKTVIPSTLYFARSVTHKKKTDSTIVLLSPLLANFYQLSYTAKMSLLAQLNCIGTEHY